MAFEINPAKPLFNITPITSFHFLVVFHNVKGTEGVNPIDIRFQKVSGIELSIGSMEKKRIGGKEVRLPNFPEYTNLTLERGYLTAPSPLRQELIATFEELQFCPRTVHVILMDNVSVPVASWLFYDAFPVKWGISDLDATQSGILIETMELSYSRFQPMML